MSGIFNTQELAGDRLLVTGDTDQMVVLDIEQWNSYKKSVADDGARAAYDTAIEEFFAPLVAASAKVEEADGIIIDPAMHIIVQKPTAGVESKQGIIVQLEDQSAIARLIELGETDRLIWVGDNHIAILAYKG